jgi:hypothetical protein
MRGGELASVRASRAFGAALTVLGAGVVAGCAGSAPDPHHPSRETGCPVRTYPASPPAPVDELGTVEVQCASATPERACERDLLDLVCRRGGDVAWGVADNAIGASHLVAHAAHSKRATGDARPQGCPVQVVPQGETPRHIENIGPVVAYCDRDDSRETCLSELENQVCRMGGDLLWQVDTPQFEGDRQIVHGRAAHTK